MRALYVGKWPEADWEGVPYPPDSEEGRLAGRWLADGFFGVIWGLKGDLEYCHSALGLNSPGSGLPCNFCQADNRDGSRPWTDMNQGAAWEATVWTPDAWKLAHPSCNPLFMLPGVTILFLMVDMLHVLHIGVYKYFLAACWFCW